MRTFYSNIMKLVSVLKRPEPVLLGAGLVIVLGGLLFVKIADDVAERDTQKFDNRMLRSLRHVDDPFIPVGPRWIGPAARDISGLGGKTVLILVTMIAAGVVLLSGNRLMVWLVLLAPASGALLASALKVYFARPRPHIVPYLDVVSSYSFPSGHSMLSAVVYITLGALLAEMLPRRRMKAYVLLVAVSLSVLVGLSRIMLGVHYPTDVLGGWLAGLVWAMLWWLFARYLRRRTHR